MKRIRRRKAEGGRRTSRCESPPLNPQSAIRNPQSGFTLVELMVSVALAIIIITLFSTIYSWSMETYSTQKGIRRNDQRSRMLVTVIKGDLNNRTFKDVVPFWPVQNTTMGLTPPTGRWVESERRGYFCISENDPDNDTDDVLFLTVEIPVDNVQRAYTARAKVLFNPTATDPRTGNPYTDDATGWARYLIDHPNQPEYDDGQVTVSGGTIVGSLNNAGNSRAAEVCYFLRNGNLYRRVLLIRDVYDVGSSSTGDQPELLTGLYSAALVRNDTGEGLGYFWRDFDYSVYYKNVGTALGPKFHGRTTALINDNPPINGTDPDFQFPRSLGIPPLRFGYSLARTFTSTDYSRLLPREYVGTGTGARFFGRFLIDETAHSDFQYPGVIPAAGDPHVRTDLALNPSQMIDQYDVNGAGSAGTSARRGTDILMTNVHSFDVKVWDRTRQMFVDLGYGGTTLGEFHRQNNNDLRRQSLMDFPGTNPDRFVWNRFDTWHPFRGLNDPTTAAAIAPPYKSKRDPATGQTVLATGFSDPALGSPDEQPLLAIQITIRFFDVTTKQMRQLTIQHSLKK
jgi:hypothetical protein